MNLDNIRLLADILSASGLTKIEVTEGDTKILLEKSPGIVSAAPAVVRAPAAPAAEALQESRSATLDFNKIIEVRSPIVGVFYASSTPGGEPFVKVGMKVKKGDVLCIVEAMKLMNEITAETDGEIADICIKNGDIAEYGQVLFKMF
jgi:acetyl-CoA carboxylase biotin carboxyl carrier protein